MSVSCTKDDGGSQFANGGGATAYTYTIGYYHPEKKIKKVTKG